MSRARSPIAALAAFELRRWLRSPGTAVGAAAFVALIGIGHWVYWSALPPRAADDHMFGWAYIIGMCGMLRFGLADDRDLGLGEYLVVNMVTPARYVAGKLLAVAVVIAGFGAATCGCAFALSAGDARYALWYSGLFTLVALLFLPAVLVVELATVTRYPAAFVLVGFAAVLTIARAVAAPAVIVQALALDVERYAYGDLAPLAGRVVASAWLLVVLYPLCRLRLLGRAAWSWGGV